MRDLVFSEDVLLRLGFGSTVRRHLEAFVGLARANGQLPTSVTDGWRRLMNQRFHFWTSDTELLFLIGLRKYVLFSGDADFERVLARQLTGCRSFIASKLNRWGLLPGADWRDAVPNFRDSCLLANQALLVDAFESLELTEEARELRERVNEFFTDPEEGYLVDSVSFRGGTPERESRFDSLGASLSVINGTATGTTAAKIGDSLVKAQTPFGCLNMFPSISIDRASAFSSFSGLNAFARNGAFLRNREHRYQNSAIWPFVEARVVTALTKLGKNEEARQLSAKVGTRVGFFEWYSPITGKGSGSRDQLWTAAAVLAQLEP
jgi:glycogen debranching enzyme